jgi:hypothetical protein
MRYLLYVSCFLGFTAVSCAPKMKPLKADYVTAAIDVDMHTGSIDKLLYQCTVNGKTPLGKKFNLSGILFLKQLPDNSTRVVFQNQMGMTYFDFEWTKNQEFRVIAIISQMDNAALIKTLQKDFEILLLLHYDPERAVAFGAKFDQKVLRAPLEKGWIDYIFSDGQLSRIQNADEKRVVVDMQLKGVSNNSPFAASLEINHLRANFKIDLQKIAIIEDNDLIEE